MVERRFGRTEYQRRLGDTGDQIARQGMGNGIEHNREIEVVSNLFEQINTL